MKTLFIDEIIRADVECVSELVLPILNRTEPLITGVYFQQGHPLEVIKELQKLGEGVNTKSQRYPLVALFRDFPEEIGVTVGIASEATVNMIIATRTDPNYNSEKRKEKIFKPILYPIYEALIERLSKNPAFMGQGTVRHRKIDHYFWGRESVYGSEANIFKDWIDCIEIKNLNLKLYQKNC